MGRREGGVYHDCEILVMGFVWLCWGEAWWCGVVIWWCLFGVEALEISMENSRCAGRTDHDPFGEPGYDSESQQRWLIYRSSNIKVLLRAGFRELLPWMILSNE